MPILMSDGAFAGASPSATGRNPSQILVASPAERAQITPSFGAAMDDALRTILSKAEAQVADPVEPAAQDKLADPPPDDPPTDEATGVGEAMDRQAALAALPPVAVATPARLPASADTLERPISADQPKAQFPLGSAAAQVKAQVVMQAEGAVPTPNIAARDAAALTIPATQQVLRVAPAMQAVSTPLSAIQAPEDAPSVTVPTALPSYPATAPASPESQQPNTRRPEAATPDAVNSYVQTNQPPVAWAALDTSLATTTLGDDQTLFGQPLALDSAAGLARIDRPAVAPQPLAPAIAKAVSQQVAVAVTQQSDGQTEIRLNPEELGRVRLALNSSETGITLTIATERPETADLIRRNLDGLAQEFRALGYTDIAFDFAQSDDQPAQDDPKSGDQMVPPSITSAEENSAPVAQSHHATGLDLRL